MTGMITVGILLALLLSAAWYAVSTYNKLVSERLKVDNQWSQIDIVLKQRNDTIPNLVKIVEGYATHEKELLEHVTEARNRYVGAETPEQSVHAASELSTALGRLFAVAENYPDLKANANFMDLQNRYYGMESKIADFRQFFNDTVMRYNRLILTFPSSVIAGMFHFEQRSFFQVEETDKQAPTIQF